MKNEDIRYVFGSNTELSVKYELAFNWIARGLQEDYDKWVKEYQQNPPNHKPEPRLVRLVMFRANTSTPELLRDLKRLFPGNDIFFVTSRFLRNAFQRAGEFKCLGEVDLARYTSEKRDSPSARAVWVFPEDATVTPLFA